MRWFISVIAFKSEHTTRLRENSPSSWMEDHCEPDPDFSVEADPFVGFNPDGSFALAGYVLAGEAQLDRQVRYYNPAGDPLGVARQRSQTIYKDWNHHLAFGPTGAVYQLLSDPDHSVQILRLGFTEKLSPFTPFPIVTSTPLTALSLSESPATEEEQARKTLVTFFDDLSQGIMRLQPTTSAAISVSLPAANVR